MFVAYRRTLDLAEAASANTTLTATRCSVANCATAVAVATGIGSPPSKNASRSACSGPNWIRLAM